MQKNGSGQLGRALPTMVRDLGLDRMSRINHKFYCYVCACNPTDIKLNFMTPYFPISSIYNDLIANATMFSHWPLYNQGCSTIYKAWFAFCMKSKFWEIFEQPYLLRHRREWLSIRMRNNLQYQMFSWYLQFCSRGCPFIHAYWI